MPLRECGMNKFCFPFNLHAVHIFGNCTVLSTNLRQQWVDDNQQPAPNPLFAPLQIDASATQAAIGSSGEVDRYLFNVASANRLVVETTAPSDTVMYIAGPNNPRRLHSSNDDGGQNFNARVDTQFIPGTYFVYVVFYDRSETGNYAISVSS